MVFELTVNRSRYDPYEKVSTWLGFEPITSGPPTIIFGMTHQQTKPLQSWLRHVVEVCCIRQTLLIYMEVEEPAWCLLVPVLLLAKHEVSVVCLTGRHSGGGYSFGPPSRVPPDSNPRFSQSWSDPRMFEDSGMPNKRLLMPIQGRHCDKPHNESCSLGAWLAVLLKTVKVKSISILLLLYKVRLVKEPQPKQVNHLQCEISTCIRKWRTKVKSNRLKLKVDT